jgi:GPH family glycoside/pentoside/hexuronide:cation symporter
MGRHHPAAENLDGINDPIMGGLMDSLKPGKRGKFKSYIYFGSFLLIVSARCAFCPSQMRRTGQGARLRRRLSGLGYVQYDRQRAIRRNERGDFGGPHRARAAFHLSLPRRVFWRISRSWSRCRSSATDQNNNLLGNRLFIIALIMGVAAFFAFQILLKGTVERVQ